MSTRSDHDVASCFVGANHNLRGLKTTPAMATYNKMLRQWALRDRDDSLDASLLESMRLAYERSWPDWGAVWTIFGEIRTGVGIENDAFAFVNLARCPDPDPDNDNEAITNRQRSFPLASLVQTLDARVFLLAKRGTVGNAVTIPGEFSR